MELHASVTDGVSYQQTMQMQEYKYTEYMSKLNDKWTAMKNEFNAASKDSDIFKNHMLPLARVKKIMKSDEDVKMISAEAPGLFAKACEMFITELTYRAWYHTEENKRRTLQRSDISTAVSKTDVFDFLVDVIPKENLIPCDSQSEMPMPPFGNIPVMSGHAGAGGHSAVEQPRGPSTLQTGKSKDSNSNKHC
eukprot:TRINITY_DN1159_c0_g2_i3.p2 TRINITY_DN1159_c0_g2~~TRINITY_DN1159_c0_g2_i3.p2  ORF type:complete len:206 (-),score=51.44 TRINITY_DN1159_c0_g2_i3:64-642(-)